MSNGVFAEGIDCGNGYGCDWAEFIDPDVMEVIVAESEKTYAQTVIKRATKRKFQQLSSTIKGIFR